MKHITIPIIISFIFLTTVLCNISLAEQKDAPFVVVKNIKGEGFVNDGDMVMAEKIALVNARIASIEKAVGVRIESGTIVMDGFLADDWIETLSRGVISDYTIINKDVDRGEGIVTLWIDAVVKTALLPEKGEKWWEETKSNFSVMVLLNESWQPGEGESMEPVNIRRVQPHIEGVLSRNNYNVLSERVLKKIIQKRKLLGVATVKDLIAENVGLEMVANLSIGGDVHSGFSSRNRHMTWYRSEYNLEIARTDNGQVINTLSDRSKGAGSKDSKELSNRQAHEQSIQNGKERVAQQVLEALDSYMKANYKREVIIEVQGLPDFQKYRWFLDLVKRINWVEMPKRVYDKRSFNEESSKVSILYKEKPYFLAYKLDKSNKLEVIETQYSYIIVRYIR